MSDDGQWMDLQTVISSAVAMAKSKVGDHQDKALRLLYGLTTRADETVKSEMARVGAIELMASIMDDGIATENVDDTLLMRIRQLATLILWNLCIGHADNKKRAAAALPALTKQLGTLHEQPFSTLVENLKEFSLMAIWSICYGIIENKKQVVESDGANLICMLLMKPEANFEIRYAASGAIWHISELPAAADAVVATGAVPFIVALTQEPSNDADRMLVPCLALSSLAYYATDGGEAVKAAGGLECVRKFVEQHDPLKFESPFVWTTVKPLVDLLESKWTEVNELGCFLSYSLCTKSEIAKLFTEGVVAKLKQFAADVDHKELSRLARLALKQLGIQIDEPVAAITVDPLDVQSWLEQLHLQQLVEVFSKHSVTLESVTFLEEKDLESMEIPLGPRKQLLAAIDALRRHNSKAYFPHPVKGEATPCLVCYDAQKTICFVPCGHVVTCDQCAEIIRAREDPCVICRTPVTAIVKPFFV